MPIMHIAHYYRSLMRQYEQTHNWDAYDAVFEKWLNCYGAMD